MAGCAGMGCQNSRIFSRAKSCETGLLVLQDAELQLKSQHAEKKEAQAQKQRLLEAAWEEG